MGGDDFVYHADGTSGLGLAIRGWAGHNTDHVIMGHPISREAAPKYGILQATARGHLAGIDEKPPLERVPEHPIANISRYQLSDRIWPCIDAEMARDRGHAEHLITRPITAAVEAGQSFYVHPVTGRYLDGGSFEGLLEASNYISAHPRVQLPTTSLS